MSEITDFRIVVLGSMYAGKASFLSTIRQIEATQIIDNPPLTQWDSIEDTRGTAIERLTISDSIVIYFFVTPSARRFDFMWDILDKNLLGFIVLVDSLRPELFSEAKSYFQVCYGYSPAPYVIAANKQDLADAWSPQDIQIALQIPSEIKVLPLVATDKQSVKQLLLHLLDLNLQTALLNEADSSIE